MLCYLLYGFVYIKFKNIKLYFMDLTRKCIVQEKKLKIRKLKFYIFKEYIIY